MSAELFSLGDLSASLNQGNHLTPEEVAFAAKALLSEAVADAPKAEFLRALARKGETAEEIAGFVTAFLGRANNPNLDASKLPGPTIDVCGTGGDRLDLFNVSTAVMFILAAGGAAVVKHGNRSISSQCGGADVLEALGVKIDRPPAETKAVLEQHGLAFFFAPHYHPSFRVVAPVRKALAQEGVTSVFNLLGPLLNPARPDHQLVGIYSRADLQKYASVLQRLGRKSAWVVHGRVDDRGMDEISTLGDTHVEMLEGEEITSRVITPAQLAGLGIQPASLADLRGGTREENAAILLALLEGNLHGPKRDLVALNAAAGFVVAGLAKTLDEGLALAGEQIDSGRALAKLHALRG